MTTWRLFYDNRFPAHAVTGATLLDTQRAAAGTLSVRTGPVFTSSTGARGFGIGDGRNLTYRPDAALRQVIGLDVSLEIAFLRLVPDEPVVLCSTDASSLTVTATGPPAADGRSPCRLVARIGNAAATVDGVRFRQRSLQQPLERRRLQVRWTTNGQLHVFLDGQLAAYEHAASPGFAFTFARWSIGDLDRPMTSLLQAAVTGARVVELREDSALDSFVDALDPGTVPELPDRCVKIAQAAVHQHLRQARALMALFNASRTRPWRPADGGTPFTPEAIAVHEAGGKAGVALSRYLRDGTDAARDELIAHLRTVLPAVAGDQPQAFKALVAAVGTSQDAAYDDCADTARKIRDANPALAKKLDALQHAIGEVVATLGA